MFRKALSLPFKLVGIPVKLDLSFLLVLPLFAWLIGSQIAGYIALFRRAGLDLDPIPLQEGFMPYLLGFVAAVGLFSSVLIHELGHALTARAYGVKTREITLWFLGGVAQFDDLPKQRGAEAVVAIAGPITSFLLAGLFWILWHSPLTNDALLFILSYLSITNGGLALFNLLPALPLDGGRVLRSLLALRLGNLRATQFTATISRALAIMMGVYGFMTLSPVLMAIAFFIYNAIAAEAHYARISEKLGHLTVRDIMTPDPITVDLEMPLSQFVQLMFFKKHQGYPVVNRRGQIAGFARPQDASQQPETSTVESIMVKAETIQEDEQALEALKRMADNALGRFVVLDQSGKLVGILSKTDLIRVIQ